MILTIDQIKLLWQDNQFKDSVKKSANVVAFFILSEPNYGIDEANPSTPIQVRINSYWQKRYNLANRLIQNPEDPGIFRMLMYSITSGNPANACPVTFNGQTPVYKLWDANEADSLAGFIKNAFNHLAGVRSNEYPWAGENGPIEAPAYYDTHFAELPNRF